MNIRYYYFIDEFNKNEIEKLSSRISLIYRNYENKCDFSELKKLVLYCKNKRRKVYISNNLKTAIKYNFDGLYIPSFNKKLGFRNIVKNNFEIIGSAHNVVELKTKEKQGCNEIFISPVFKIKKANGYLGIVKFNLLANLTNKKIVALGGINQKNYRELKSTKINGFACISWAKKNGLTNVRPFLKLSNS